MEIVYLEPIHIKSVFASSCVLVAVAATAATAVAANVVVVTC